MRFDSKALAFSNSALRAALNLRPARLMKYVSILMPEAGPFGETFFDARLRAMVAAFCVKSLGGGCVESVVTFDTQRFFLEFAMRSPGNKTQD